MTDIHVKPYGPAAEEPPEEAEPAFRWLDEIPNELVIDWIFDNMHKIKDIFEDDIIEYANEQEGN